MAKTCIITFGKDETRRDCDKRIDRLAQSLARVKFADDFLPVRDEYPAGCPTHFEAPYAFKTYCFMEARAKGYDLILWLDASVVVIRPIEQVFRQIERDGHILFNNPPWYAGQWCSDEALKNFGLGREEALKIPEISSAAVGLDMRNATAVEFLRRWHAKAGDGITFRGVPEKLRNRNDFKSVKWNVAGLVSADRRVFGHRFDQTAAGIIAHQLGMKVSDNTFGIQEELTTAHSNKRTVLLDLRDVSVSLNRIWWEVNCHPLMALLRVFKRPPPQPFSPPLGL